MVRGLRKVVIAASPVLSIVYAARSRAESPRISRVELENEQNCRFHTESISDFRCDLRRSTQRQRKGGNNHFLRALVPQQQYRSPITLQGIVVNF